MADISRHHIYIVANTFVTILWTFPKLTSSWVVNSRPMNGPFATLYGIYRTLVDNKILDPIGLCNARRFLTDIEPLKTNSLSVGDEI